MDGKTLDWKWLKQLYQSLIIHIWLVTRQQGHSSELGQQHLPSRSSHSTGPWQWYTFVYRLSKHFHLFKNYKERDRFPISPGLSCDLPLRHARRFADLWTVAHQAPLPVGVLQATVLECAAMPSSRGSSQPRDQTQVSHIASGFFASWATGEAQEYWKR